MLLLKSFPNLYPPSSRLTSSKQPNPCYELVLAGHWLYNSLLQSPGCPCLPGTETLLGKQQLGHLGDQLGCPSSKMSATLPLLPQPSSHSPHLIKRNKEHSGVGTGMSEKMEVQRRDLTCFVNSTQGGDMFRSPNPSSAEKTERLEHARTRHGSGELRRETRDSDHWTLGTWLYPEKSRP